MLEINIFFITNLFPDTCEFVGKYSNFYFSLQTDVADGVTFYAGVDANTGTELNTGNPSFSISSGNNDGEYGNFEYSVPSGYYAMCTKRLAEFG